jgi:hypothetical protein
VGEEIVVGGNVQSWARSTDVLGVVWRNELVGSVAIGWDLVTSLLVTLLAVLGVVVLRYG